MGLSTNTGTTTRFIWFVPSTKTRFIWFVPSVINGFNWFDFYVHNGSEYDRYGFANALFMANTCLISQALTNFTYEIFRCRSTRWQIRCARMTKTRPCAGHAGYYCDVSRWRKNGTYNYFSRFVPLGTNITGHPTPD